jgi:serine/threonine protein kinase
MDIGQLEQFEEIGRGGMGIVYKAWSTGAKRWLAVKKLHPQLAADLRYQKLIQKEALSLSLLKHPNIVSLIAFGSVSSGEIPVFGSVADNSFRASDPSGLWTDRSIGRRVGDEYGMVMDYIDGLNLKEWLIVNGPPSFERLLPLFLEISSALAYLHQNNIFHLDLKPENILISHAGKPYLSDFGIASIQGDLQNTAPLTGPFGTLEYISPEQARGEAPDGRSDLYSLGMIFYTLIHGKSFFKGMEKTAVWGKIVYETQPFSLTFPPEIPPHFQSVIRKLVEKEPAQRFPDVQSLLEQWRPVGSMDRPVGASTGRLFSASSFEKPVILAFGLALVVVLFLIGKMFEPPKCGTGCPPQIARVQSRDQQVIQEVHETPAMMNGEIPTGCRTGCQKIEIVFLNKEKGVEKEFDSPGPVFGSPDPQIGLPPTPDDHELEAFLMEFKRNAEQKDLGAIEKEIRLSPSGRERFQEMFRDSREINVEFQQIKREGASIIVDSRMSPSIQGTLFFQDRSWHLQFSS